MDGSCSNWGLGLHDSEESDQEQSQSVYPPSSWTGHQASWYHREIPGLSCPKLSVYQAVENGCDSEEQYRKDRLCTLFHLYKKYLDFMYIHLVTKKRKVFYYLYLY